MALPAAILMKSNAKALEQRQLAAGMKKCPHGAELVKADALKAPPSRAGKIALGVVLVFGALFVLMMVIGLLTAPGARDTTSPTAARESAVEPATLGREPEAEKVQASLLVAAYERNEIAADQQFKGTHRRSLARLAVSVCGRDRH